jgi:hypothetical protein
VRALVDQGHSCRGPLRTGWWTLLYEDQLTMAADRGGFGTRRRGRTRACACPRRYEAGPDDRGRLRCRHHQHGRGGESEICVVGSGSSWE